MLLLSVVVCCCCVVGDGLLVWCLSCGYSSCAVVGVVGVGVACVVFVLRVIGTFKTCQVSAVHSQQLAHSHSCPQPTGSRLYQYKENLNHLLSSKKFRRLFECGTTAAKADFRTEEAVILTEFFRSVLQKNRSAPKRNYKNTQ